MSTNKLPDKFIERLHQIVPAAAFDACLESFGFNRKVSFRVNTLKASTEAVLTELQQQGITPQVVTWLPHTFQISAEQRDLLTHSTAAEEGRLYIQGLSSMLPPLLLDPQADERILDIAAAPGSKTLQMAAMMGNDGWISAVELVKTRFFRLKDNIERQGATNIHTYLMDGARVWHKCPEQFDRVLVDAPCSSESRFKASVPESFRYWSEKKIKDQAKKQVKILFSAIQSLKPGGKLVYATCSFAPEENELTVSKALKTFGDAIELESIDLPISNWQQGLNSWGNRHFDPQVERCRRILPNEDMEGFFLCKVRKTRSTIRAKSRE